MMLSLTAKIRKIIGKKVKKLREQGILPVILYGTKIKKPLALEVDLKEFEMVYQEAGESSMIELKIEKGGEGKNLVLIKDVVRHPVSEKFLHADLFQPSLTEKIEAMVPLVFEGEAVAVRELGGTLVKHLSEIEVKALPQKLPKEIRVDVSALRTFEDEVMVKDLRVAEDVEFLRGPEEVVAVVILPEKVEEELEKPIEEKVEEVEKVGEGEERGEEKAEEAKPEEKKVEEKAETKAGKK